MARKISEKVDQPIESDTLLSIQQYLAERRQAVTYAVENLLQVYFPDEAKLRKAQHEEEMTELARYVVRN